MNVHPVLHLHGVSGTIELRHTSPYCDRHGTNPKTMRKAVALAHLRVAAWEPDDDDDEVVVEAPALPASPPQLLPVPSAWWETLTCWGLSYLSDDAELIIAELVGNAVRHGLRAAPQLRQSSAWPSALRLCLLRRVGEVMLAVTDPSDDIPAPKAPSDNGESGRG